MDYNEFMFSFLKREKSMFASDLEANSNKLTDNIKGKQILIIGGAGTIGSSFLKAALKFEPKNICYNRVYSLLADNICDEVKFFIFLDAKKKRGDSRF